MLCEFSVLQNIVAPNEQAVFMPSLMKLVHYSILVTFISKFYHVYLSAGARGMKRIEVPMMATIYKFPRIF